MAFMQWPQQSPQGYPPRHTAPLGPSPQVVLSFEEVRKATGNFSKENQIGNGGFGPVYKGTLLHTPVAVKVLSKDSMQGVAQFDQEVRLLTGLRHPHLVLLLGGSVGPGGERCLVYELMTNGSVDDFLPGAPRSSLRRPSSRGGPVKRPSLTWKQRLQVALGAAKGLLFLHRATPPVVHLDFKGSNVLLDASLTAKVGDFGLAKQARPTDPQKTHVSTRHVSGTYGYICPEFASTGHFDARCDVYSFGVFLLQLLTASDAITPAGDPLAHLCKATLKDAPDGMCQLADPTASWPPGVLTRLAELALECTRGHRAKRPWMDDVVERLMQVDREETTTPEGGSLSSATPEAAPGAGQRNTGTPQRGTNASQRDGTSTARESNRSQGVLKQESEDTPSSMGRLSDPHRQRSTKDVQQSVVGSQLDIQSRPPLQLQPPYSASYVLSSNGTDADVSAIWRPERPLAPKPTGYLRADPAAPLEKLQVTWWPKEGGGTLTLEDAPGRSNPEQKPAAGGPSGGPLRGGLSPWSVTPPAFLRGASPAVRLSGPPQAARMTHGRR